MRKSILSLAVAAAVLVPGLAVAQQPAPSPLTGNITLINDYRFRGISQTFHEPAIQGGFDYAHASGLYVGNWNSNVSQGAGFPGGNIEMDFYGGYKKAFGDLGLDVGFIYYYYPGTNAGPTTPFSPFNNKTGEVASSGKVDNKEIYIGGSWKWLSLKFYDSIDDYFSTPGTKNTYYFDLSGNYDLGNGWGVNGHLGHLKFKGMSNADYTDWKIGVTKDINGWVLGAAYLDTNAKGNCGSGEFYCFGNSIGTSFKDAGKGTVLLSISKTF